MYSEVSTHEDANHAAFLPSEKLGSSALSVCRGIGGIFAKNWIRLNFFYRGEKRGRRVLCIVVGSIDLIGCLCRRYTFVSGVWVVVRYSGRRVFVVDLFSSHGFSLWL